MQQELRNLELLELSALLIDTNKQFTDALKAGRPHAELVEIYTQIKELYAQINFCKSQRMLAA